jgi:hypothetical protein
VKRPGRIIAALTLAVVAPRMALSNLGAEQLPMSADARQAALVFAAVALAVLVAVGQIWVIETAAAWRHPGLAACWVLNLGLLAWLLHPQLVAGIRHHTLPAQLLAGGQAEAWSWVALVLPELVAAAAVWADVVRAAAPAPSAAELRVDASQLLSAGLRASVAPAAQPDQEGTDAPQAAPGYPRVCDRCGTEQLRNPQQRSAHFRYCKGRPQPEGDTE